MRVWTSFCESEAMRSILTLVANTGDGVCGVDMRQRIVLWNEAAARLTGFPADEVLGKFCFSLFRGRSESGVRVCRPLCAQITAALNVEPIRAFELGVRHRSGATLWLSMSTISVPSRWSHLTVLIHLFREITQEKEALRSAQRLLALISRWSVSEHRRSHPTPAKEAIGLTPRQTEVLRALGAGSSTARIAERLRISPATARAHVRNILTKLGVHSRLEAVTLALRNGLI